MSETLRFSFGLMVAAASVLGYGLLAARFTKINSSLAANGVIGTAILSALLMTEHFFIPLQPTADLVTLIPGVICFAFLFRWRSGIELVLIAVTIWWAVQFDRMNVVPYDHALYHLQSAIWNTLDPAIPGITNLHTRLGFNSAMLVLGAGLNIPKLGGWSLSFLASALMEGMIAAELLLSIRSSKKTVSRIYCLIAAMIFLLEPRWVLVSTYMSPDPVAAMGVLYAILLFLEKRISELWICAPFLITVKLSTAPLVLLLDWNRSVKKYKVAAAVGMVVFTIWVARNVVLSGHLIFPVAATKLPVSWAERNERTQDTADWIRSWARDPGKSLQETSGWRWIKPWLGRNSSDAGLRASVEMSLAGLILLIWKRALRGLDWRLILSIALAIVYWFVAAPEYRFAAGFLLGFGFLLTAYALDRIELLRLDNTTTGITIAILVVLLGRMASVQPTAGWPHTEQPAVRLAVTPSGGRIWAPIKTDQCWAVIPCSPEPQTVDYYPPRALLREP